MAWSTCSRDRLGVNARGRDRAMSQSVLDGSKAPIGRNHSKAERVLQAVAVPFILRHACFCCHGLEHSKESTPIEPAALLGREDELTGIISLVKPCL